MENNFDLDKWWLDNVDPEISVLDKVYKEITQEAIEAAIKLYAIRLEKEQQMNKDSIDLDEIDLSDVLC